MSLQCTCQSQLLGCVVFFCFVRLQELGFVFCMMLLEVLDYVCCVVICSATTTLCISFADIASSCWTCQHIKREISPYSWFVLSRSMLLCVKSNGILHVLLTHDVAHVANLELKWINRYLGNIGTNIQYQYRIGASLVENLFLHTSPCQLWKFRKHKL